MTRRKPAVILSIVALALALACSLGLVACSKGEDLTRPKALAFEKLGEYGPRVSALIGRHGDLRARLDRVVHLPAAAEVAKGLETQHAGIASLKGLLDGYAVALEKAGKASGTKGIEAEVGRFTTAMDQGLASATAGLDTAEQQLAALEGPAAVTDGDAGVPGDGGAQADAGAATYVGPPVDAGAVPDAGATK